MANLLCDCHDMHPHPCISHPFLAKLLRGRRVVLTEIDLTLLAQQNAEILEELRALRREVAKLREQSARTLDFERRNDPRRPSSLTQR
ncbi:MULTISPECIES: hypothetical protein [Rhizobium]|uniref:hypothetical protein n=1 Tax=Rhizobium TaxID=379 RepID=UPI002795957B|nr:hypothetical protein [Rhizobium aegyptiacum]